MMDKLRPSQPPRLGTHSCNTSWIHLHSTRLINHVVSEACILFDSRGRLRRQVANHDLVSLAQISSFCRTDLRHINNDLLLLVM